ncbi:hypothetical protein TYRP_016329 [Tyrophagus putrescentiae]|nr:hypothetical protein TYRP_016329 [Tyrophagus putrescentiae]
MNQPKTDTNNNNNKTNAGPAAPSSSTLERTTKRRRPRAKRSTFAGGLQRLVLPPAVLDAPPIGRPREGDHGVEGHPGAGGQQAVQQVVEVLPHQEGPLIDQVAHLHVVVHRQVDDRVAVGHSFRSELLQDGGQLLAVRAVARGGQQLLEDGAVLEAAVHALAVEGHHGVGGVAHQQHLVAVVVRLALDRDQRRGLGVEEGGH